MQPTIKHGGKGRRRPVEARPSNLRRVPLPSVLRKCSGMRRLVQHGCYAIAATALATAAAQAMDGAGPAPIAEAVSIKDDIESFSSVLRQGARAGLSARRGDERSLHGLRSTEHCIDSPLWGKEVDPANYMFGCKEIEDMLHGSKTLVGNGEVRDVYVTEYKDNAVVVKVLREGRDPRKRNAAIQLHKREALTLNAVRGHPNIVEMLGICNTTLVTQYHATSLNLVMWSKRETFSIDRVVSMALDAAMGLQALHEASIAPIVHFDMKPQQLLIVEDGRLMLNDFNMARFMGTRGSGAACPFNVTGRWTMGAWQAPEKLAGKHLTEKVDIYSMGMIFFSLISGKLPFPPSESGSQMILQGVRPAIDPSWHTGFMKVVQSMWQTEPADRPSARQVVARLEDILDALPT